MLGKIFGGSSGDHGVAPVFTADVTLYQTTLEQTFDGLLYWDVDGREFASAPLQQLLIRDTRTTTGSPYAGLLTLFDGKGRETFDQSVRRLRMEGKPFTLTLKAISGKIFVLQGHRSVRRGRKFDEPIADVITLRDDTKTINQMDMLKDENERLRHMRLTLSAMIDHVPTPMWVRAPDTSLVLVNEAYRQAITLKPDSNEIPEIAKGLAGEQGRALAMKVREDGRPHSATGNLVLGGKRRYVEVIETPAVRIPTLSPISEGGEKPFLSVGFIRDLTEVQDLQIQTKRQVEAQNQILESLENGIVIYGPDRRVNFYNTAYCSLWGLERKFLDTQPRLSDVLDKLRERRVLPEYSNFVEFKKSQDKLFTTLIDPVEELEHLPDGRTLRVVTSAHPLGGLMFMYEDVSENIELTSSYNTLIQVQKETLDKLYEGVAVFGSDGRLKLSNPTYRRLWNLPVEAQEVEEDYHIADIIDRNRDLLQTNDRWDEFRKGLLTRMTDRQHKEGRLSRSDGRILDYAVVPLPDGASLHSYVDVTDQFRVEQALRDRNEALEEADRLKSEFIANVSYGLRTPLNVIMGFADILNAAYFGTLNERQQEYTRGIASASQELMTLINDILDIATLEAGYMTLEMKPFAVRTFLQTCHDAIIDRAARQRLTLTLTIADDVGEMVGDEKRLRQALHNILSNALAFTPIDGSIALTGRRQGNFLVFSVTDTGIGMDEETRQTLFTKFRKVTGAARAAGNGVGLSLVKSFVDLHGGTIDVQSAKGQGTTISLTLPSDGHASAALAAPKNDAPVRTLPAALIEKYGVVTPPTLPPALDEADT